MKSDYDVMVIGGGPAGLAAAASAQQEGAHVLIVEREAQLGGILKQCVHDGFGQKRYGEALTGPEYATRDVDRVGALPIDVATSAFVLEARRTDEGYQLMLSDRAGIHEVRARALVLATGCRERTARQIFIHGDRPAGVFTAGCAQNLVNVQGVMVGRRVVVVGSGDIGLIMARRLTLEGATVLGVYEAKSKPSGLPRNVAQCLDDFAIPLHLSMTVTRTLGRDRLEAVEVSQVDDQLRPIAGTEQLIACDTLILSVGLIPENELAEQLEVPLDETTKGPVVDQDLHTLVEGVFAAGNCVSVNDLVDYVSENGSCAGRAAAAYVREQQLRDLRVVELGPGVATCVPQRIDLEADLSQLTFYLRSDDDYRAVTVTIEEEAGGLLLERQLVAVRQAETVRLAADLSGLSGSIRISLEQGQQPKGEEHG